MLTNPVFLSVVLMLALCALRFNVFLAILCSGLFAGIYSKLSTPAHIDLPAFIAAVQDAMSAFIAGMSGNLETSLAYVLVGAIAAAVARSNLAGFITAAAARFCGRSRYILLFSIAALSCLSQNLIPIHIAFIPILIPPLLAQFARLKIDRRALACALTFGITTPYVTLPLGFGLIYHSIIAREISKAGGAASTAQIAANTWPIALVMLFGLVASVIYYSRKSANCAQNFATAKTAAKTAENLAQPTGGQIAVTAQKSSAAETAATAAPALVFTRQDAGVLAGLVVTLLLQLALSSLPLSALAGFLIIIATGGIRYRSLNEIFGEGFAIMGYVAFIMLVAAGFGAVLSSTGAIEQIVQAVAAATTNKFAVCFGMMAVGLLITLGIGSSFGTVPIIAAIFVPICQQLGFSDAGIIFIIAAAAFIGDTGSPASEATLGVHVGINADGRAEHVRDVCYPTMIFYNLPLIIAGTLLPVYL